MVFQMIYLLSTRLLLTASLQKMELEGISGDNFHTHVGFLGCLANNLECLPIFINTFQRGMLNYSYIC